MNSTYSHRDCFHLNCLTNKVTTLEERDFNSLISLPAFIPRICAMHTENVFLQLRIETLTLFYQVLALEKSSAV